MGKSGMGTALRISVLALWVFLPAELAYAQQFPSRPIRLTVPASPGGSTDVIARVLAKSVSEQTRQPVVVENKAGASGAIGVSSVVRAAPDGYTLLVATNDPISVLPAVKKTVPYNVDKDLSPITLVGEAPFVFAINSKLPVKTMREFLALAASKPGQMTFASAGPGTSAHLIMEMLKARANVNLTQVPYKGVAPSMQALVSGEVDILATTQASLKPFIESGSLKALATAAVSRSPGLLDVPTTAEAGLPNLIISAWWGAFAPAGVPSSVLEQLDQSFRAAMAGPEYQKILGLLAIESNPRSHADFGAFVSQDTGRWREAAERANITVED